MSAVAPPAEQLAGQLRLSILVAPAKKSSDPVSFLSSVDPKTRAERRFRSFVISSAYFLPSALCRFLRAWNRSQRKETQIRQRWKTSRFEVQIFAYLHKFIFILFSHGLVQYTARLTVHCVQ